jgi:hypothetical protein
MVLLPQFSTEKPSKMKVKMLSKLHTYMKERKNTFILIITRPRSEKFKVKKTTPFFGFFTVIMASQLKKGDNGTFSSSLLAFLLSV